MEILLAMLLTFSGGYVYRWVNEPEPPKISFYAPPEITDGIDIQDCKQGTPATDCPVSYPRFVLSEKEYAKDIENGKATRVYLNQCIDTIEKYNGRR